ncbi:MAG: hemerythrin domain-containing protein [Algoriphagus aquaeductus]|jgi:hemerythrin-like domain-containing protein|uniref:Hemerythrin HHE cation binding domain-containing protein n=3 Tax=Algoriphagus aquaeductus TaxID=475299 RepID=A0A326RRT7_9BACT|nr:hemerythrin domain-containing protein [Algoriphagus aquaeductus]PZV76722.1 hemerythrin HHE cation binding domain-containing protein [Algoriphagus aquaeductus]
MQTLRLNPYLLPHKGLRYLFGKVSLLAGNVDQQSPEEVLKLKELSHELFYLLEQHAHVEDHVILPDLEKRCPGSTQENQEEHEYLESLIARLEYLVNELSVQSSSRQFFDYFLDLSEFHSKYTAHMIFEERSVLGMIWENYTDEELIHQHHRIVSSFSPEKILRWFKYIIPALAPTERIMALGGLKANAPQAFFDQLMSVVKTEMDSASYLSLMESLEEQATA